MDYKKALEILFNTYWSEGRWIKEDDRQISDADFEYAVKAGIMFKPIRVSHHQTLKWVFRIRKKVKLTDVTNSFISSLSTRRLDMRSALGSFAFVRILPNHWFKERNLVCSVCGMLKEWGEPRDINVLNFERYKWGGVRHSEPLYMAFDLERFLELPPAAPTAKDWEIFEKIVSWADSLKKSARPADLEKQMMTILDSNKQERRKVIEILGYCGILQPRGLRGFFDGWIDYYDRKDRTDVKWIDWQYPISWWRGSDGVNQSALKYYFPQTYTKLYQR